MGSLASYLAHPPHVRLSSSCDKKSRLPITACDFARKTLLKDLANAGSKFDARPILHMVHTVPVH